MSRNLKLFIFFMVLAIVGMRYLISRKIGNRPAEHATAAARSKNQVVTEPAKSLSGDSQAPKPLTDSTPPFVLTTENIETSASICFQGKRCEFGEDPWGMYRHFRDSQHPKTCDTIIALLRRKMSEPEFREKYRGPLLSMIEDFYSPLEIDFQRAAYYAYLGELEKSLNLYLELEKRQAYDAGLRPAPKLNIANVYYDLHRLAEALPYYRAALEDLKNSPEKLSDQRAVQEFIEKRIEEISGKIPVTIISKEATR
jgi:hypothetical protein